MIHPVDMYNFHVWANQTMFNRLKELPQELYKQEVQSSFPSLSKGMAHIYTVDFGWLDMLSGKSMVEALELRAQREQEAEAQSLEGLEAMFTDLTERYKAFFAGQADFEKQIVLDNPYAGIYEATLSEMVMQVVNHGTYHRGNISAMLRQLGHASVMTEYALFWYQKASR
ncbi:MAG: DinB [Paenibacillus sp.]|nr:DinB [Paenibacillus sp.]